MWKGENDKENDQRLDNVKTVGWLVSYVDDLLATSKGPAARAILEKVGKTWKCSQTNYLEEGQEMNFVGLQLYRIPGGRGIVMHQKSYTENLLAKHGLGECNPSKTTGEAADDSTAVEAAETVDETAVKEAQQIVGELIWLSTRTRPDISFTVHRAATMTTRSPELSLIHISEPTRPY